MPLSPNEAADALRDIAAVETRSARAYGYQRGSPYLILWGILWVIGYGLTAAWPQRGQAVWIAVIGVGLATTVAIGFRSHSGTDVRVRHRWMFPRIALIALVFIGATLAVMGPVSPRQVGAFIPLVVAFGYALRGIWGGIRFIVAGAIIAAATLAGFFLLPAYFDLWMAVVGGGALVLAGVWLQRA